MADHELTEKQKHVLAAIIELIRISGSSPTLVELMEYLSYSRVSSIQRHIAPLRMKGYIDIEPHKSRGIRLKRKLKAHLNIPLVGNISCGNPLLALENIEAYISYPAERAKYSEDQLFFLRAVGDSMNKAGINSGDFVLLRRQSYADNGQKVAALIDDEATIKVLRKGPGYISLEPCSTNKKHKPIIIFDDTFLIQGVVLDVISAGHE